jgi:ferredoxin
MKIHLDRAACQGHGRCYALSPRLFGCDDEGYAVLEAAGEGEIAPDDEHAARLAAESCPEYAITIE